MKTPIINEFLSKEEKEKIQKRVEKSKEEAGRVYQDKLKEINELRNKSN